MTFVLVGDYLNITINLLIVYEGFFLNLLHLSNILEGFFYWSVMVFLYNWVVRFIARFAMRFVRWCDIALRFSKYLGRSNQPKMSLETFRR